MLHIGRDRGRLELPSVNVWLLLLEIGQARSRETPTDDNAQVPPKVALKKQAPTIIANAIFLAIITAFTSPITYFFFRSGIWHYTLVIARAFFWLNRSSTVPSWTFASLVAMFFRSFWICLLLGCIWESAHIAFNVYFTEEPIKDGKTISEKSPDPNATLVSGLKSSGYLTGVTAFSELVFIAHNSPSRRKSIFKDVNKKPTSIWEQILKECLAVIEDVNTKVSEVGKPLSGTPTRESILSSWMIY